MAKAVEKQCGIQQSCSITTSLASTSESHAMDKAHAAINRTGECVDVKLTKLNPEQKRNAVYVMYPTDMVQAMLANHTLDRLYGGLPLERLSDVLVTFWSRLRKIHPELAIFLAFDDPNHPANPAFTIPCYTHGDEGRGQLHV
jgi:hypothetical protein